MPKLTKKFVDSCVANGKEQFHWDDDLPGYGLRVFPSGKRSYFLQYRHLGRTRRYAIGLHGKFTPETARNKAQQLLGEIAKGNDPSADRKKMHQDVKVSQLCDDYLVNGCSHKKASTLATDKGRIERHIKPLIGQIKVTAVTKSDIAKFAIDVAKGKTAATVATKPRGVARVRGGQGTASRTIGLLGAIFTYAVRQGLIVGNPVRGVERAADGKRNRFLTDEEITNLGKVLHSAKDLNAYGVAAIRLLLLTGCRRSEILGLQWSNINWTNSCFKLTDSKTGAKEFPVGNAALELLKSIPRYSSSNFVFPAIGGKGHFQGLQKIWDLVRKRAEIEDVRIHDLRRTFGSTAAMQGQSLLTIGKILGHADPKTTAIYAHLTDKVVAKAAEEASAKIQERLSGN